MSRKESPPQPTSEQTACFRPPRHQFKVIRSQLFSVEYTENYVTLAPAGLTHGILFRNISTQLIGRISPMPPPLNCLPSDLKAST